MKLTRRLSRLEQSASCIQADAEYRLREISLQFWARLGKALAPFGEIKEQVSCLLEADIAAQEREERMSTESLHQQIAAVVGQDPDAERAWAAEVERVNTEIRERTSRRGWAGGSGRQSGFTEPW